MTASALRASYGLSGQAHRGASCPSEMYLANSLISSLENSHAFDTGAEVDAAGLRQPICNGTPTWFIMALFQWLFLGDAALLIQLLC
jgi:hypothetical protein